MCGGVPTRAASVLGEFIEERPTLQKEIFLLLTTRKVVSVRASGRHGVHVVPLAARLAYHLHLALVTIATRHARIPHASGEPPAPAHVNRPQSLVALDVRGRAVGPALRYIEPENSPRVPTGFWQRPETPPSGPCRLRQGSLAGLAAQWGHVALALGAYPRPILGSAFFSCLDAEYYVRGWPLDVAILLDAAHPGSPPAPIPGAQPIKGVPGYFDVPGDLQGARTATRRGEAWLVAEGGRGVRQRVEVLRDLTAFVR